MDTSPWDNNNTAQPKQSASEEGWADFNKADSRQEKENWADFTNKIPEEGKKNWADFTKFDSIEKR